MPFKYGRKKATAGYRRFARKGKSRRNKNMSFRKKFHSGKATTTIIKQPAGLADRLLVKLKYTDLLSFTSTTGAVATHSFRGNSPYAPDFSGGGTSHQPYLWDQWATFYQAYLCHGSKIKIECQPSEGAASTSSSMNWCIVPTFSSAPGFTTFDLAKEQPYSKTRSIGGANIAKNKLMAYQSTRKFLGLNKRGEEGSDQLRALISSSPTLVWYWNVLAESFDDTATTTQVCQVSIEYYIEFYRRALNSSS